MYWVKVVALTRVLKRLQCDKPICLPAFVCNSPPDNLKREAVLFDSIVLDPGFYPPNLDNAV